MKRKSRFAKCSSAVEAPADIGAFDGVDDYMSIPLDAAPQVSASREDPRPRKLSKAERAEERAELMNRTREEGLSAPIGTDNKGFHLLSKFGYSQGGLGKDGQGILDPVGMTHRPPTVTVGLGIEEKLKEEVKQKEKETADLIARRDELATSFMVTQAQRHEISKITRELRKNRKIIFTLDQRERIGPHELWNSNDIEEMEDEEEKPTVVALEM